MISNHVSRIARLMPLAAFAMSAALGAHADEKTVTASLDKTGLLGTAGVLKGGSLHAAADPAFYSNTTNFEGTGYSNGGAVTNAAGNTQTSLAADDITLAGSQSVNVTGFAFSVVNFNAAAVSARPRLRFYLGDGAGSGPGTYLGGLNFNAISFPAGTVNTFNYNPGATLFTLPASTLLWVGETFDNNTGATGATAAQLNNLGEGLYNPPTVGSSQDVFFQSTGAGAFTASNPAGSFLFFGGNPVANFGFAINGTANVPEPGAVAMLLGFGVSSLALLRRRTMARK